MYPETIATEDLHDEGGLLATMAATSANGTPNSGVDYRPEVGFTGIVGESRGLREVLELVDLVASTDSTVLLRGETGTGKELIARAIHDRQPPAVEDRLSRSIAPPSPAGLLESELLATSGERLPEPSPRRRGRLELADQGTLFLDEIGDIPLELQPKLLRLLQEREYRAAGQHADKASEPSGGCRDASRSGRDDPAQSVSQRSLLPAECLSDHDSSSARAGGRHSAAGAVFCRGNLHGR